MGRVGDAPDRGGGAAVRVEEVGEEMPFGGVLVAGVVGGRGVSAAGAEVVFDDAVGEGAGGVVEEDFRAGGWGERRGGEGVGVGEGEDGEEDEG